MQFSLVIILVPLIFAALALFRLRLVPNTQGETTASAGSLGFFSSVATLVASAAGVWILFSPPQAAGWAGLKGLSGYALGQAAPFFVLAILGTRLLKMLPQGYSLPTWANTRYGRGAALFALVVCFFYMGIFLAAELTAIGTAAVLIADIPRWLTVVAVAFGTWLYTNRGGFGSVVWTDKIQFAILLPLLILMFVFVLVSLPEHIQSDQDFVLTETLFPQFGAGFGVTLFIAILAAQVFNQTLWQRAYACRNERVMRWSFFSAGLLIIPIILIAGSFGIFALRLNILADTAETELFLVMAQLAPEWLLLLLLLVAILLVMSSLDSLLNALAECATEFVSGPAAAADKSSAYIRYAVTSVLALLAALVAMRGYSVLYLFLLADLICAGTVFPLFYGLYKKSFSQSHMLVSAACGILCGLVFMISPSFGPLFPELSQSIICLSFSLFFWTSSPEAAGCANIASNANTLLLLSFICAPLVSGLVALLCNLLFRGKRVKE